MSTCLSFLTTDLVILFYLLQYLGVCVDIAVRVDDGNDDPVEHVHQVGVGGVGHQLPQYEGHRSWTDPLPGVV